MPVVRITEEEIKSFHTLTVIGILVLFGGGSLYLAMRFLVGIPYAVQHIIQNGWGHEGVGGTLFAAVFWLFILTVWFASGVGFVKSCSQELMRRWRRRYGK